MSHSGKPRGTIDFGKAYDQQQSPLFTMLPLDIRRHIYLQLWRHYGTTQHIYLFSPNSYLSHYPCLLEKDAFNHYRPSSPAPPEPEGPAEAAAEAGVPNFGVIDQPGSHDDPGDIDGAIQDLAALQPQPQPDVSGGMSDGVHNWNDSPWCMHEKCFRDYIGVFNMSFERAYSRNYKRAARSVTSEVGITKPLLVCKKMYTEASESLYSKIAFSFPDMVALERFINDVPRSLIERIPAVDITTTITADGEGLSWEARSLCIQDSEIRLTIHLTGSQQQNAPRRLPNKEWFEPLYRLSSSLSQRKLRKLDIKLITRCDIRSSSGGEDLLTYGCIPEFLKDAPFSAVLVAQGWHSDSECCAYWVNQDGGQDEDIQD